MNNPAASFSTGGSTTHSIQLARYSRWLDHAYAMATSTMLRQLITELSTELRLLAAAGAEAFEGLQDALHGSCQSIIAALDIEAAQPT